MCENQAVNIKSSDSMSKKLLQYLITLFLLLFIVQAQGEATSITFWHSMSGQLGDVLNQIIEEYNASQNNYRIISIYKGEYTETLTNTVAAFRAKQHPDMVQIFEVGTASMLFPKGAIVPLHQIFTAKNNELEEKLLPVIHAYYADETGHLAAFPFNCSSPVMYYNKDAFKKAGIKIGYEPITWLEVEALSQKLLTNGYECAFTTAWPSWIQLEAFCSWHNIPYASDENGFKNVDAHVVYNSPLVIKHLNTMAKWQKQHIFQYGGRNDEAQALFTSGKCPILFESSGSRPSLMQSVGFSVGVAPLPYWPTLQHVPQNTTIGGGAIWVLSGHAEKVNEGIANFFAYLASTPVQVKWQSQTGYLPVTQDAISYLNKTGFYLKHPEAKVVIDELTFRSPASYSKGIRLGNYTLIRQNNDTALEEIWSGKKTAEKALNDVIKKNNLLLHRFKESVSIE